MYGTVARLKVAPGRFDELVEVIGTWERERKPSVSDAVGSLIYRLDSDPDTLMLCVAFGSKSGYEANASDPEQDKWYQRFRECLAADPEWMDGEIVYSQWG